MQVSIKTGSGLNRRATITISAQKIESAVKKKLIDLSKKVQISGFRLGKAPMSIIRQRYDASVRQNMLIDLIKSSFLDTIIKQKIHLAGDPNYIIPDYEKGNNFTYSVDFEVYPLIELKDLSLIKIKKPIVNITEQDIDGRIEKLRSNKLIWKEKNIIANINHQVTLDFRGWTKGKKINNWVSNFVFIIGKNNLIPDFEKAIIGHKKGDVFNVSIKYPQEHNIKSLRNKNICFEVVLKKVESAELPELTKEFFCNLGITDGSMNTFRNHILNNMQLDLKELVSNYMKLQAINCLLNNNLLENIPNSLIQQETKLLAHQASQQKNYLNHSPGIISDESLRAKAKIRININLLLCKIISDYKIQVSDEEVKNRINKYMNTHHKLKPLSDHKNHDLFERVHNLILEEKAIALILDKAEVSEKIMHFQEILDIINHYKHKIY